MMRINTAKGAIDTSQLGVTLMHEHIFVLSPEINQNYPESWGDEEIGVHKAVEQLRDVRLRRYAEKIVLSHDDACYNDWFQEEELAVKAPNWNFLHILKDVVPALKERGVADGQIRAMLVDNPRRIFEGKL